MTSISQVLQDYKAIVPRKLKLTHKPWMRQKEIDLILTTLKSLNPGKCLEWGSGYSSLYFPSFTSQQTQWLSLEHEPAWAATVQQLNKRARVKVETVLPNHIPWEDDGTYEDFRDYVEFPDGEKYDFILVDGRARKACVKKSSSLLSQEGVIILHDANRQKYRDIMDTFPHSALFTDHRSGYGGIWMGANRPLEEVLDVSFYQEVWKAHDTLAKYFSIKKAR